MVAHQGRGGARFNPPRTAVAELVTSTRFNPSTTSPSSSPEASLAGTKRIRSSDTPELASSSSSSAASVPPQATAQDTGVSLQWAQNQGLSVSSFARQAEWQQSSYLEFEYAGSLFGDERSKGKADIRIIDRDFDNDFPECDETSSRV